ncbi:hypothetical protein [Parapedobacter koreensis]|uniref:Acyl carrier protein phosphodiesterase n=1 Tax=Parapedobacter koreensis TaxID=332977 RepID=A0A1H7G4K9_9SPHI|nr:hypothetical protein [Parapedobacter koreensis]SEK33004.1 hypothetical protein SAMN05421740_101564 [Parapedobacter koreensis]
MNFLSHYYFERYSHDPELVLGSVLPDLIKNADRNINIWPQKYEDRFGNNPKLQSIYHGWMRHIDTDRYFHNSSFFYSHTHALKILLAPTVDGTPIRPSFLSHIGLELLLDHLLLRNNWVHESDFYAYLAAIDYEMADRFLRLCDVNDTEFFFVYFSGFMRTQYIQGYWEIGEIASAMVNICRRLWDVRAEDVHMERIVEVISEYTAKLDGNFHPIFDEIRSKLL